MTTTIGQIQHRRGIASLWSSNNPILADGEFGIEDGNPPKIKIGDGVTAWNALSYWNGQSASGGMSVSGPGGTAGGNSGAAQTIGDPSNFDIWWAVLNAATPAITLPPASQGMEFSVRLDQDATGGRTPTFVAGTGNTVVWPAGNLNVASAAHAHNWVGFTCADGTTWEAFPLTGISGGGAASDNSQAVQICPFLGESAKTGTGWELENAIANALFGGWRSNAASPQIGDTISFDVDLAAGTWELDLLCTQATNRGTLTVKLDGTSVGTIDQYNGSVTWNVVMTVTGIVVAASGKHTITFNVSGQNASAADHVCVFQWITLRKTA